MTEQEYRIAIAQQQAVFNRLEAERQLEIMRAQDRATGERIRMQKMAREQAAGIAAFTGTAYYPYDIDKPTNPPIKQANARVIEPPRLPEK